jgi:putative transposase
MTCVCGVATLDGLIISRPEPMEEQPQHLCLDAAYDSTAVRQDLLDRHYMSHIRSRGQEKIEKSTILGYRVRRSRGGTHPLLAQSLPSAPGAALEKKVENYLAFLHLACAQRIFAKLAVFG